jgi:hypothetical protein
MHSLLILAQIVLIFLKATGLTQVAELSWLYIFIPTYIIAGIWLLILVGSFGLVMLGLKTKKDKEHQYFTISHRKSGFETRLSDAMEASRKVKGY